MTNNKTFLTLLLAGAAVAPTVTTDSADAAPPGATIINKASLDDLAPVSGNPPRLRRTDEEQPHNEMPCAVVMKDATGKVTTKGWYFVAAGSVNGLPARRRVQGAMIPFSLAQLPDGTVRAEANQAAGTFITDNTGNEYRQFNNSTCAQLPGTDVVAVFYNVQLQGTNDTKRYVQTFNGTTGASILKQTVVMAKNNDDCSMHQDGQQAKLRKLANGRIRMVGYYGCNGNGNDDGWAAVHEFSPTGDAITKVYDASVCPREERSRGTAFFASDDVMLVSWTEGNTQPQRDGVWVAALRLNGNDQGPNQQNAILWKQQIAGREDKDGIRTYAMRMKMEQLVDPVSGIESNKFFINWGALRGNNNTNGKGGTYYGNRMGLISADATGLKYDVEPLEISSPKAAADGLEYTHLGSVFGNFGTEGATKPGIAFLSGGHFGGGLASQIRFATFDDVSKKFVNAGTKAGGPHDRHLYPNYLGNNPGNQGRNHSQMQIIDNPFTTGGKKLLVMATTAKDTGGVFGGATEDQSMNPAIKLAAWLTVVPVVDTAAQPDPTGPDPTNPDPSNPDPSNPDEPAGESLGGCSTGGGSTGMATLLLLGLAAFFRRRR
jgi:uncharacterized protein (TIGR03382 family)